MVEPKPPQQLRAQRTRRELIAAARRVFGDFGYEHATVDQIAQVAGCSKGAYYFHFSSKEDTLLAVLDAWIDDRTRRLDWAAAQPPEVFLRSLARALSWRVSGWESKLAMEFWSQAQHNERAGERVAVAYRAWTATLTNTLAIQCDTPLAAEGASIALSLFDGLALQSCFDVPASQLAEAHAGTLLESIVNNARRTKAA
jgi:AcrR family transcriptional regulator